MARMTAFTVWFTGLPASGKSALARQVQTRLEGRGLRVELIDSGRLRRTPLGATMGFSRDDRDVNVRRHAFAAHLLAKNGVVALVSAVSPYRGTRGEVRAELGDFFEVWVRTPRAACIERDESGNWARALQGEIRNFTGVDGPYEAPEAAELETDLSVEEVDAATARLLEALEARGWVPDAAGSPEAEREALARGLGALGYVE